MSVETLAAFRLSKNVNFEDKNTLEILNKSSNFLLPFSMCCYIAFNEIAWSCAHVRLILRAWMSCKCGGVVGVLGRRFPLSESQTNTCWVAFDFFFINFFSSENTKNNLLKNLSRGCVAETSVSNSRINKRVALFHYAKLNFQKTFSMSANATRFVMQLTNHFIWQEFLEFSIKTFVTSLTRNQHPVMKPWNALNFAGKLNYVTKLYLINC